jgi:hypothetical protein
LGLVAPYLWLARGEDVEPADGFWQEVVVNAGIVGRVIFLIATAAGTRRPAREAG